MACDVSPVAMFLMEAATLHNLLQSEQKMGERQKDRQKNKDEDTNGGGVWLKHHRYWSNSTDFEWMIWVESGVINEIQCNSMQCRC